MPLMQALIFFHIPLTAKSSDRKEEKSTPPQVEQGERGYFKEKGTGCVFMSVLMGLCKSSGGL